EERNRTARPEMPIGRLATSVCSFAPHDNREFTRPGRSGFRPNSISLLNGSNRSAALESEYLSPVALHVDDRPALGAAFIERLVELADMGFPVIRPFTLRVGMMHDSGKARAIAGRRPLQHREIAVGIAEGEDRPPADEAIDADGLARSIVDEFDFGDLQQLRLAIGRALVC